MSNRLVQRAGAGQHLGWVRRLGWIVCAAVLAGAPALLVAARQQAASAGQAAGPVAIDPDDIGGVVTSANGPEAGVWVIAEAQLQTKFRKIVVTDDLGRYVLPDLPRATYKIW
ncbi:MAG: carboxypeptidase-like regulatory domain-containing protein, partial [Acidobacteriota bacterium]